MIGREKRVLLRHYLEQGMSKAAIARHLRISRRTVYNWIEAGELDRGVDDKAVRYPPRAPLPSKLDPFKEIIRTRLADYPELSAVRLFEEVKAAGYPGGYGVFRRFGPASTSLDGTCSGGHSGEVRDDSDVRARGISLEIGQRRDSRGCNTVWAPNGDRSRSGGNAGPALGGESRFVHRGPGRGHG